VFISEFADPIKRGGYSNASPMQVQLAYRCALVLRDLINPFLLRRQKKDIKEVSRMPGKTEQVLFCKLSSRQRNMYEAYLKTDEVKNIIRGSAQCFRPIIILRKICNHPDLICRPGQDEYEFFQQKGFTHNDENDNLTSDDSSIGSISDNDESTLIERSGKLEVLAKILPLWKKQGHRVLIFSQWKKMLDIIQHFVRGQGWKFGRLDGDTNVSSRQKIVDSFNTDNSYFGMLLTTKTGGVGLNLTGANRIVLYDPDWNPQNDIQARK
jgi:Superfamily II DNA/RNA helicases, SNF2 family